ncbi:MAG: YdcF family protein [Acetobacteraceae bacterium]
MTLHGLLVALVVPPANLPLLGLAGYALRGRWRPAGRAVTAAALIALLVLSLPTVALALLLPLERGLPLRPDPAHPPRAIVILSAEVVHPRGPRGTEALGPITLSRMRAGVRLARRTGLPVLVSGGRLGGQHAMPIAARMAISLKRDFGIAARWVEPRSKTTWQNAEFSAAILRRAGITSAYVVTDAWHEKRAILAFRHFGIRVTAAPVVLDAQSWTWLPSVLAWRQSYFAFHEYIGGLWYAWLAWRAGPIVASNKAA